MYSPWFLAQLLMEGMLPVPRVRGIILMPHLGDGPAAHTVLRVDGADGSYHIGNGGVVSQSINAVFLFMNR